MGGKVGYVRRGEVGELYGSGGVNGILDVAYIFPFPLMVLLNHLQPDFAIPLESHQEPLSAGYLDDFLAVLLPLLSYLFPPIYPFLLFLGARIRAKR